MSLEDALTGLQGSVSGMAQQYTKDAKYLENALNKLQERMGQLEGKMKDLGLSDNQYIKNISDSLDSIDGGIKKVVKGVQTTNDKLDDIAKILTTMSDKLDKLDKLDQL